MSAPKRPSSAVIAKAMQKAARESAASEPEYRTRIINDMNKECADRRQGIYLRLPQPSPGHCIFIADLPWTEQEAARYLAGGTLPRDLVTIRQDVTSMVICIFDARGCGEELPELELDRVPDFEKHPAMCIFETHVEGHKMLIPSGFLDMVPTGPNKVKFVLNEERPRRKGGRKGEQLDGKKGEGNGQDEAGTEGKGDGKGKEDAER